MKLNMKELRSLVYKGDGYEHETDEYELEVIDPIIGQPRTITSVKLVKGTDLNYKVEVHLNLPRKRRAHIKPEGGPNGPEKS